jgi:hypothetical protein
MAQTFSITQREWLTIEGNAERSFPPMRRKFSRSQSVFRAGSPAVIQFNLSVNADKGDLDRCMEGAPRDARLLEVFANMPSREEFMKEVRKQEVRRPPK